MFPGTERQLSLAAVFSHCPEQRQARAKLPAVSGPCKGLAKTPFCLGALGELTQPSGGEGDVNTGIN